MTATLSQQHTLDLRIGAFPILVAAAAKGGCVGFRIRSVEECAINGDEPIAPKERDFRMLAGVASNWQRSCINVCTHWLPSALRRPLSPESLMALSGCAGCRSLSVPTRLFHTWHWLRRLPSAIAITNSTRLNAVLNRTRRTLVFHGSLCRTHRSITSRGYISLSMVILTCSHTLSSIVISRNLYIESSFVFSFLVVCQMGAFLSSGSSWFLK
jgi:hypothetical protein